MAMYLTGAETAAFLRCSKRQVERMAKEGRLTPRRLSYKQVLYSLDEIVQMVESCKQDQLASEPKAVMITA